MGLLSPPKADPGFLLLNVSIALFRRLAEETSAAWVLQEANNIGGVLLGRLQDIGWSLVRGTTFCDQSGVLIDLLQAPGQEVHFRLVEAWHEHVGDLVEARKTLQGMYLVDVHSTARGFAHFHLGLSLMARKYPLR